MRSTLVLLVEPQHLVTVGDVVLHLLQKRCQLVELLPEEVETGLLRACQEFEALNLIQIQLNVGLLIRNGGRRRFVADHLTCILINGDLGQEEVDFEQDWIVVVAEDIARNVDSSKILIEPPTLVVGRVLARDNVDLSVFKGNGNVVDLAALLRLLLALRQEADVGGEAEVLLLVQVELLLIQEELRDVAAMSYEDVRVDDHEVGE
mmetsp:Transcript_24584/g.38149  ORF Transcript_24584/g.38149 Transcript_24584/m.38149 type:complete len:206 (+) Transcript_24584:1324-1941(+)